MQVMTIVGARPQFIKAAPVSRALRSAGATEVLVHTGQHYDTRMSGLFFDEMGIPAPTYNLGVGSGSHGAQTARMLEVVEELLMAGQPDAVVVYGDTNSTLAGALAAIKLQIPLVHIESGLRSRNRSMPEEHNRVLTDHAADLLFCPTQTAVDNLRAEGLSDGVHLVGDTMYDAVLQFGDASEKHSVLLDQLELDVGEYVLATIHRPYNTDDPAALHAILAGLAKFPHRVVFPVHPRTRSRIAADAALRAVLQSAGRISLIDPVGYLDMLALERNALVIVTDSGGIQKEAYFLGVRCVTIRPETEWIETLRDGWNRLVGNDAAAIANAVADAAAARGDPSTPREAFGDGRAAERIVEVLQSFVMSRMI